MTDPAQRFIADPSPAGEPMNEWPASDSNAMAFLEDGLKTISELDASGFRSQIDAISGKLESHFANDAIALERIAECLLRVHFFRRAEGVLERALSVDPENARLHHQAGHVCTMLGKYAQRRFHVTEAVRLAPRNAFMQYNLATLQLTLGNFLEGWQGYGWLDRLPATLQEESLRSPPFPEWKGESVDGRTFLLVGEQGHGDQIQFLRLAQWLQNQGAVVDVQVWPEIEALARAMASINAVWTGTPVGPFDYWSRMFRVPQYMRCDPAAAAQNAPYLSVQQSVGLYWRARLEQIRPKGLSKAKRIGVVWAGNPAQPNDRYRSMKLETLEPLIRSVDATWFSLQKGRLQGEGRRLNQHDEFFALGPMISDYADTLAIMQTLDLVITVDTSVAHLAGAAGIPTWVLLPTCADWRWLADRNDSPWYSTMRLFRQCELGDWAPVIEQLKEALRAWSEAAHA